MIIKFGLRMWQRANVLLWIMRNRNNATEKKAININIVFQILRIYLYLSSFVLLRFNISIVWFHQNSGIESSRPIFQIKYTLFFSILNNTHLKMDFFAVANKKKLIFLRFEERSNHIFDQNDSFQWKYNFVCSFLYRNGFGFGRSLAAKALVVLRNGIKE